MWLSQVQFSWTFSIPQILAILKKMEFFNTHAWFRQLPELGVETADPSLPTLPDLQAREEPST
jgi:hypothetical protein